MNVETSIGENYHFELHDALLVYQGRGTSFVTRHEVTLSKSAPPVLGPAQPLTVSFIDALVRSVGGNVKTEILPDNILAKGDRMTVCGQTRQCNNARHGERERLNTHGNLRFELRCRLVREARVR